MTRRNLVKTALFGAPVAALADTPSSDRPRGAAKPMKIAKVEVLYLEKPLKERFWMANSPIGGYNPKASRLIVTIHTDAGSFGPRRGRRWRRGSVLRKGFADLVIGEDPFMVGKIWEKMFAVTYGREPSSRGWSQNERDRGHGADRRRDLRHHGQVGRASRVQVSGRLSRQRAGLRDGRLLPRRKGYPRTGERGPAATSTRASMRSS